MGKLVNIECFSKEKSYAKYIDLTVKTYEKLLKPV